MSSSEGNVNIEAGHFLTLRRSQAPSGNTGVHTDSSLMSGWDDGDDGDVYFDRRVLGMVVM